MTSSSFLICEEPSIMVLIIMFSEQVKVLALTDHDTMAGVPEVLEAARKYGIRIIPGVEISTTFSSRY